MRVVPLLVFVALLAGCGGGSGETGGGFFAGMDAYEASGAAKEALERESVNPDSPVFRKTFLVGHARHATMPEGGPDAWRVDFLTLDEEPTGVCIWVRTDDPQALKQTIVYDIGGCPAGA